MLYYNNLEEIIFHRHELFQSDELVVVSGYLGPSPVSRLSSLPLNSKVIYGMYGSEGVRPRLHNSLLDLNRASSNTTILYSNIPIHSKCYVWKYRDRIVHALIGSANFSTNGLSSPYREVLAETTYDTFSPLDVYIKKILENCISCDEHVLTIEPTEIRNEVTQQINPNMCEMTLLDPRTNEVPDASGLNWGHGNAHNGLNDAYIAIRTEHIRNHRNLFPPKQRIPTVQGNGRVQRQNDPIEIIWDDGTTMEGLLEGTQPVDGIQYPKQISSSPEKDMMGEYIRRRMAKSSGTKIYKSDLVLYGRTSINISLQSEGVYYFDFSDR